MQNSTNATPPSALENENRQLKRLLVEVMEKQVRAEKLGRVFHDFNNMLSSTMGYASLALEKVEQYDDEKLARYLSSIERAAIRARDLVRDCLEQRQLERNVTAPCKPHDVLKGCVGELITEGDTEASTTVSMSAEDLTCMLRFLQASGARRVAKAHLHNVMAEHCERCDAELPMASLRVEFDLPAAGDSADHAGKVEVTDEHQLMEFSLAAAMVNMSGGHMCVADSSGKTAPLSGISYFRTLNLDEK